MNVKPLATEHGVGGRDWLLAGRFGDSSPGGAHDLLLSTLIRTGSGAQPASCGMGLLSGGKAVGA